MVMVSPSETPTTRPVTERLVNAEQKRMIKKRNTEAVLLEWYSCILNWLNELELLDYLFLNSNDSIDNRR